MTRRKGELSARMINRDWPYQIASPDDQVIGDNCRITDECCRELSLSAGGHTVRHDNGATRTQDVYV